MLPEGFPFHQFIFNFATCKRFVLSKFQTFCVSSSALNLVNGASLLFIILFFIPLIHLFQSLSLTFTKHSMTSCSFDLYGKGNALKLLYSVMYNFVNIYFVSYFKDESLTILIGTVFILHFLYKYIVDRTVLSYTF